MLLRPMTEQYGISPISHTGSPKCPKHEGIFRSPRKVHTDETYQEDVMSQGRAANAGQGVHALAGLGDGVGFLWHLMHKPGILVRYYKYSLSLMLTREMPCARGEPPPQGRESMRFRAMAMDLEGGNSTSALSPQKGITQTWSREV